MNQPEDARAQRDRFEERFQSEVTWRDGLKYGVPGWYNQLLTDLVLATGVEPIKYFSAKYVPERGDQPGSVAVVAFTSELVAYANLDDLAEAAMPTLEVVVMARRALTSFSLETLGESSDSLRVTVRYPGFSRTLPLAESDWSDRASEVADLITHLRRDVVA